MALICGAAFLVAGVVLLSVMLATIRQRTAEIGLRKAVGADTSDIRDQMVSEVVLIAAAGCGVGVVLAYPLMGIIAPMLAAKFGFAGATVSLHSARHGSCRFHRHWPVGRIVASDACGALNPVEALRRL